MNQHVSGENGSDLGDLMGNLEQSVKGTQGTVGGRVQRQHSATCFCRGQAQAAPSA